MLRGSHPNTYPFIYSTDIHWAYRTDLVPYKELRINILNSRGLQPARRDKIRRLKYSPPQSAQRVVKLGWWKHGLWEPNLAWKVRMISEVEMPVVGLGSQMELSRCSRGKIFPCRRKGVCKAQREESRWLVQDAESSLGKMDLAWRKNIETRERWTWVRRQRANRFVPGHVCYHCLQLFVSSLYFSSMSLPTPWDCRPPTGMGRGCAPAPLMMDFTMCTFLSQ